MRFSCPLSSCTVKWGVGVVFAAAVLPMSVSAGPQADATARAVTSHVLPSVAQFAAASQVLNDAAKADCTAAALRAPYNTAFDAWMGVQHLNIGPIEENGRFLTIAFWPDKKGAIPRALTKLISAEDPIVTDAEAFTDVSVAARGFFALEYMLFDDAYDSYAADSYACHLVQAIAQDMSLTADDIKTGWGSAEEMTGYAATLLSAGAPENERYYTQAEGVQALYTMLTTGLENTAIARLGRPLGSFEKPRPRLAEARRSDRSMRNVILSVEAAQDLAVALAPMDASGSLAAFDDVLTKARALDDPALQGVDDPSARLKIEILQQRIEVVLEHMANDIGLPLGVSVGFNASDGD
jgi:predicted lipoprotein